MAFLARRTSQIPEGQIWQHLVHTAKFLVRFFGVENVLQPHMVGQTIFKWRIGFAGDEWHQMPTGRLGYSEAISTDELGRQELSEVANREWRLERS